jgi:hypothetical protein
MAISTPTDFRRIEATTIGEQIRQEEVNIVRNQKVLALLESNGRITFNHGGKRMEFNVKKARNRLVPYQDGVSLDFPRVNRWDDAALNWRGYTLTESVGMIEKEKNKGPAARIDFVAELAESMMDDFKYGFGAELFIDGEASGNESRIHGFESFLGFTSNAQYTAASDTYAGLSTTLGGLGGAAISGTWPIGQFDPEYDAWTPLIVNYTHANWTATTDTWADNADQVLRAGIIHNANMRGVKQGMLELILTDAEMYRKLLGLTATKEHINITRGESSSKLVSMGFRDTINFDGVDVSYESEVPADRAYGINSKTMELKSMKSQLINPSDDFDLDYLADRYVLAFVGNLQCNPRGFTYWRNIT